MDLFFYPTKKKINNVVGNSSSIIIGKDYVGNSCLVNFLLSLEQLSWKYAKWVKYNLMTSIWNLIIIYCSGKKVW